MISRRVGSQAIDWGRLNSTPPPEPNAPNAKRKLSRASKTLTRSFPPYSAT